MRLASKVYVVCQEGASGYFSSSGNIIEDHSIEKEDGTVQTIVTIKDRDGRIIASLVGVPIQIEYMI